MDEKEIIRMLEEARLPEFKVSAAREQAKKALFSAAKKRSKSPSWKLVTALAGMFALAVTTYYMIDTMDEGNKFNRNGGVWSTYSDSQEGGNSVIWPPPSNRYENQFEMSAPGYGETGYAVRITGSSGIKLGQNYNYIGLVNRFSANSSCPKCQGSDISRHKGIMFKIKGRITSGQLFFILPYESSECVPDRITCKSLTGYADYEKEITFDVTDRWNTVTIDFRKDLKQPFWTPRDSIVEIENVLKSVHLFKWQYKNGGGETIEFWIDDVQLY